VGEEPRPLIFPSPLVGEEPRPLIFPSPLVGEGRVGGNKSGTPPLLPGLANGFSARRPGATYPSCPWEKNSDAALAGGTGSPAGKQQTQPAFRGWPIPLFPWRKTQTRALVRSDGCSSWIMGGAQGRRGEEGSGLGVAVRSNDCPRLQTVSPSGKGGTSHPRFGFPARDSTPWSVRVGPWCQSWPLRFRRTNG
jgi:hypothetical protein